MSEVSVVPLEAIETISLIIWTSCDPLVISVCFSFATITDTLSIHFSSDQASATPLDKEYGPVRSLPISEVWR